VILVASVAVWALSWIPNGNVETSLLARFGHTLEPLGRLMGLDWKMMVALLSSFVAKENSIATLGVLFGGENPAQLAVLLRGQVTAAAAVAFLVVQMLFVPCAATVGAMHSETHSWRWTTFSVLLLLALSLGGGILSYFAFRALGYG